MVHMSKTVQRVRSLLEQRRHIHQSSSNRNWTFICAYPGLVIRSNKIIQLAIAPESHPRLKYQILTTLEEFLKEEDERIALASKEIALTTKLDEHEHVDADTGVASTIIQQFLPLVLCRFFDKETSVRLAAVNLINYILKRRLVHPIQCTEHIRVPFPLKKISNRSMLYCMYFTRKRFSRNFMK